MGDPHGAPQQGTPPRRRSAQPPRSGWLTASAVPSRTTPSVRHSASSGLEQRRQRRVRGDRAAQLDAIKGELDESLHQLSEIQQEIAKLDDDVLQSEYSQLTQGLKLTYLGNLDDTQGSIDPALESLHLLVDDLHAGTTAPAGGLAPCAADVRQCPRQARRWHAQHPELLHEPGEQPGARTGRPVARVDDRGQGRERRVSTVDDAVHGIDTDAANGFQNGLIGTNDSDGAIVALLKASAARLRTDHQMVTSSYYENYKKIGDHLAFQTALLATTAR